MDKSSFGEGNAERPAGGDRVFHGQTVMTVGERDSFLYTIKDPVGIHARPAGAIVGIAKNFKSEITLSSGGKTAKADSIISIMSLGAVCGTAITVRAVGEDSDGAISALKEYFRANL